MLLVWLSALGLRAGAGKGPLTAREAQLWAIDLSSQGETQDPVRCPKDSVPSWPLWLFLSPYQLVYLRVQSCCPAAEESLQDDTDLLGEICR